MISLPIALFSKDVGHIFTAGKTSLSFQMTATIFYCVKFTMTKISWKSQKNLVPGEENERRSKI